MAQSLNLCWEKKNPVPGSTQIQLHQIRFLQACGTCFSVYKEGRPTMHLQVIFCYTPSYTRNEDTHLRHNATRGTDGEDNSLSNSPIGSFPCQELNFRNGICLCFDSLSWE